MGINAPFLDQPDEDLICQICHGVLDQPITLCQQGHTYCKSCMHSWIHRPRPKSNGGGSKPAPPPHCPGCMLPLGTEVRNLVAENLIAKLRVRCTNAPPPPPAAAAAATGNSSSSSQSSMVGSEAEEKEKEEGPKCGWTGRLEELPHHRKSSCQYETITCPYHQEGGAATAGSSSSSSKKDNGEKEKEEEGEAGNGCGFVGWRRQVTKEHAPKCQHRPVACSLRCGWKGKKLAEARHQGTDCPKVLLFCRNKGCLASFERSASEEHYGALCAHQPVPCVFAPQGCTHTPLRKDQARHQAEAAVEHASLTSGKITDLEKGMAAMLQRFEDLRLRVEHSEKATRETIVSLVANPTPGIWIVLYSRIRSWNGGALLGAMNRGAIGYDRLSSAIDLFLDGVVSSTLPALPSPSSSTPLSAAADTPFAVDAGIRPPSQSGSNSPASSSSASAAPPPLSTPSKLDDALEFLGRFHQQQQQQQQGCFFPPVSPSPQTAPRQNRRQGGTGVREGGGGEGSNPYYQGSMQFHRVEASNAVAFIEEVEPN